MTEADTTIDRDEPRFWTRLGVLTGFGKAGLDDLWWVEKVTEDPSWQQRAVLARAVPQLSVYGVAAMAFDTPGFFAGACIGMVGIYAFRGGWLARRVGRATRNLHGIGDKRSFWADWPASLYTGFNVAVLVAVLGLAFVVVRTVDDRDSGPDFAVGPLVGCARSGDQLDLSAQVRNPTGAPQRVAVEFRYADETVVDVLASVVVTLSPDTWQEVVTTSDVTSGEGCPFVRVTVRSAR